MQKATRAFGKKSDAAAEVIMSMSAVLSRARLPLFAVTLFISAGLMFLVEPMVAKMVLPQLGGSPDVWITCLVFFQATLLLGYAYAHTLTRIAPRGAQILVHVAVLFPLAALTLPLNIGADWPLHRT